MVLYKNFPYFFKRRLFLTLFLFLSQVSLAVNGTARISILQKRLEKAIVEALAPFGITPAQPDPAENGGIIKNPEPNLLIYYGDHNSQFADIPTAKSPLDGSSTALGESFESFIERFVNRMNEAKGSGPLVNLLVPPASFYGNDGENGVSTSGTVQSAAEVAEDALGEGVNDSDDENIRQETAMLDGQFRWWSRIMDDLIYFESQSGQKWNLPILSVT